MSASRLVIVAFALLTAACGASAAGPPRIAVDTTACSYCGMLVSEPVYAAAYSAGGSAAWAFDDIGCMLKALRHEPASPVDAWVQDADGGGWIDADEAVFVASSKVATPMSGGLLAFADPAAARRAAAKHGGDVRSFKELIVLKGEAQ
jgi:copper chaperone NosL